MTVDIWENEKHELHADVPRLLLQLIIILGLARVLGRLLRYIRQPAVIGELAGGLLLGPSFFGASPDFKEFMFPKESMKVLYIIAQLGLIFFMFYLGLEILPGAVLGFWKEALPLAVASIIFPLFLGMAIGVWFYDLTDATVEKLGFQLFTGVAISFAALTAIGRILGSAKGGKALSSKIGTVTIATATVDDLLAWTILALALLFVQGQTPVIGLYSVLLMVGYLVFQSLAVRWGLGKIYEKLKSQERETDPNFIFFLMFLLLLSAWIAEIIGVHAFFGAFFFGLMLPKDHELLEFLGPKVELLIVNLFVPIYFAYSGLNTNLRDLNDPALFFATIFLAVLCTATKFGPVYLLCRYKFGHDWKESLAIGILINARGLVSLITANIGLQAGMFNVKMFSCIVFVTLITMFLTSPIFYYIYEKYVYKEGDGEENEEDENVELAGKKHGHGHGKGEKSSSKFEASEQDIDPVSQNEDPVSRNEKPVKGKKEDYEGLPEKENKSGNTTPNSTNKLRRLSSSSGKRDANLSFALHRPDDW